MASKVLAALTCATAVAVKAPPAGLNAAVLGLCLGVTWVLTLQALLLRRLLAPEGSAPPSYGYAAASSGGEGEATRGAAGGDDDAAGAAAAGGSADAAGDDFRGWLWLAAASQASLKPKLPEVQGTAKRFAMLRGSRLLLSMQAGGGGEPPVEVDLRGCEVYAAPDPVGGGPLRRWWRRLPLLIVHRGRPVLFNERALCLFAATSFEKEAWHTALCRACACGGGPACDAALSASYTAFLRAAEAAMRAAGCEGLTAALAAEAGVGAQASPASLACLNLFCARYFFDLQRNARVEAALAQRLQEQLSRADIPPWMTRLRVVRVALPPGGAPPRAQRLALAAPGAHPALADVAANRGPIPAYEMDISYLGGVIVEVETTIDATALAAQHGWKLPGSSANPASGEEAADDAAADADVPQTQPVPSPRRPLGQALQERLMATPAGAALQDAAARLGQRLSATPIRLSLEVLELSGTLRLWLAPPPGDRLWLAFTAPPTLRMRAAPALGDRAIAHSAVAARVSDFIAGRLRAELAQAAVLPNTADVLLAGLIHAHVAEMDVAAARRLEEEEGSGAASAPAPAAQEAQPSAASAPEASAAAAPADAPPPPPEMVLPAAARVLWSGDARSGDESDAEPPAAASAAAADGPADRGSSASGGIAALIGLGGGGGSSGESDDEHGALSADGMLQLLRGPTAPQPEDAAAASAAAATQPVAAPPRPPPRRPSSSAAADAGAAEDDLDGPPRPSSLPGRISSAGAATLRRRNSTDGAARPPPVPMAPPPVPAAAPPASPPRPAQPPVQPPPVQPPQSPTPTPRSSGVEPASAEAVASPPRPVASAASLPSPPSSPAPQQGAPAWVEKLRAEAARRIAVEGPKLQQALQTNHDKLKAGLLAIRAEQAKKLAQTAASLAAATAAAAAQTHAQLAPPPATQDAPPPAAVADAAVAPPPLPPRVSADGAASSPPPLPRPAGKDE